MTLMLVGDATFEMEHTRSAVSGSMVLESKEPFTRAAGSEVALKNAADLKSRRLR